MPYDSIQGHCQDLKCVRIADFKGYFLRLYARNQKTNSEFWVNTPRQYLLAPDIFLIFVLVWCHVTLSNEFCLLRGVDR